MQQCLAASASDVVTVAVRRERLVDDVDNVKRIVRIVCYVNGAPGFNNQPFVANGASELFKELWGEDGVAARSAIGVAELPLDSPVEVELTFEVK